MAITSLFSVIYSLMLIQCKMERSFPCWMFNVDQKQNKINLECLKLRNTEHLRYKIPFEYINICKMQTFKVKFFACSLFISVLIQNSITANNVNEKEKIIMWWNVIWNMANRQFGRELCRAVKYFTRFSYSIENLVASVYNLSLWKCWFGFSKINHQKLHTAKHRCDVCDGNIVVWD